MIPEPFQDGLNFRHLPLTVAVSSMYTKSPSSKNVVRFVWLERDQELEGVMPSSWVREGFVMWPPGVNASKAMKEQKNPRHL